MDIRIYVTKGNKDLGIPAGVTVPIGYLYAHQKEMTAFAQNFSGYRYTVKHCENERVMTHISIGGMVNRFGIFFSCDPIESLEEYIGRDDLPPQSIDIPKGLFKKSVVRDFCALDNMLKKMKEKGIHFINLGEEAMKAARSDLGEEFTTKTCY